MLAVGSTVNNLAPDLASSAATSNVIVLGLGVIVPLLFIAYLSARFLRHRRRALEAEANASRGNGALVPGEAVISGRVVVDDTVSAAVTVRIVQKRVGHLQSLERWRETSREVVASPFYVARPGGDHVRVEPGDDVRLAAWVNAFVSEDRGPRVRCLTMTVAADQQVHVSGTLVMGIDRSMAGSYRDSTVPVLRPTAGRPMLISKFPLAEYERRIAHRARLWALLTLALFGLGHATLLLVYDALRVAGRVVTAQARPSPYRASWVLDRWPVSIVIPGRGVIVEDDSSSLYYAVEGGKAIAVPVLTAGPFYQLGANATLRIDKLVAFAFFAFFFFVLGSLPFIGARPWWEGAPAADRWASSTFQRDDNRLGITIGAFHFLFALAVFSFVVAQGVRSYLLP